MGKRTFLESTGRCRERERENLHFMCFETPPPLTNISLLIVLIKQANPEAKQKVWL